MTISYEDISSSSTLSSTSSSRDSCGSISSLPDQDLAKMRQKFNSPSSKYKSLLCRSEIPLLFRTTTFSQSKASTTGTLSFPSSSFAVQASINLGVGMRLGSHVLVIAIRRTSRSVFGMKAANIAETYYSKQRT